MSVVAALRSALENAWSAETSGRWLPDNPARGQCSVTALVVQDILGGDIVKTAVDGAWHYYNRIDGQHLDFSASQFPEPVSYSHHPSGRDDAFSDTSPQQYRILRDRVLQSAGFGPKPNAPRGGSPVQGPKHSSARTSGGSPTAHE